MTTHTPGPWQVNHWDKFQVCDADGEVRGCSPIARCDVGPLKGRAANARLIAAAPDLLEALQEALRAFAFDDEGPVWADSTIAKARAAIAKATHP